MFGVLGPAVQHAFRPIVPEAEEQVLCDDPENGWQAWNAEQIVKSVEVMADPNTAFAYATASLGTEPLGKQSARLQHLDKAQRGQGLLEITQQDDRGLLCQAQRDFYSILDQGGDERRVSLRTVIRHFEGSLSVETVVCEMFKTVLDLICKLWARAELKHFSWPWTLMQLVNPTVSEEENEISRHMLWNALACDLDPDSGLPLRMRRSD